MESGQVGKLRYFDSTRVNLGLFQRDVDVLWDLAVHDLSIMDYLIGESPVSVAATGVAHVPGQPVNIAYLTCFFEDSLIAHINVNWLAPVKIRRTLIGGDRQMIVYDDLEPSEKVKVYDSGSPSGTGRTTGWWGTGRATCGRRRWAWARRCRSRRSTSWTASPRTRRR